MSVAPTELPRQTRPAQAAESPWSRLLPLKSIVTTPLVVLAVAIALYVWVKTRDLDSVESRILTTGQILTALRQTSCWWAPRRSSSWSSRCRWACC